MSEADSQTVGLIINLIIGSVTVIVSLFLFDTFRRKIPSVFEARRVLHLRGVNLGYFGERVSTPPPPSTRKFGWIGPVNGLDLDTIAVTHGLDTALFLRYLRSMAVMFLFLSVSVGVVLLPIYFTGQNKDLPVGDKLRTEGIQRFSMSNLSEDDSWRFWVTLAVDFTVTIFVMFLLYTEFKVYSKYRTRHRGSDIPGNYAIIVQDIPLESCSEDGVYEYWNALFPDEIAHIHFVRDGKNLMTKHTKFWEAVTKRERAEWDMEFNEKLAGARPTHKIGSFTCCKGAAAAVDSIEYWSEKQSYYSNKIQIYQEEPKQTPLTRAAIVVFRSRKTAAIAAQTNFASTENEWRVSLAPEPNAVNWNALPIPGKQAPVRNALNIILGVLLTLFWIIPVTLIISLTQLENLAGIEVGGSTPFSFLDSVADWSGVTSGIIESFLPAVVLSVFLSLIPAFFRLFLSLTRIPSQANVDIRVRDWYFNFVVFSNFLFVILSGSILQRLDEAIADPSGIVGFLASAAPRQASFIMNFILVQALSGTPLELLQIGRVAVRWFKLKLLARTPREKNAADTGNTVFNYFRYYALTQLVAVLGLIYSTVAPFILPICFVYFAIMYVVWKYNLCFSLNNPYQDGGRMYGGALYAVWIGLFLHLLLMVGLFGLNENAGQSILSVIPAIGTIFFLMYLRKSYRRLATYGSVVETQKLIDENEGSGQIAEDIAQKYIHPAFVPLPDPVENLNGIGENTGETKYDLEEGTDEELHEDEITPADDATKSEGRPANSMSTEDWKDTYTAPADEGGSKS